VKKSNEYGPSFALAAVPQSDVFIEWKAGVAMFLSNTPERGEGATTKNQSFRQALFIADLATRINRELADNGRPQAAVR